jgi:hypothetical protein
MRMRGALVAMLTATAACAPMRRVQPAGEAYGKGTAPSALACIDHPEIDAWEKRLRSERSLQRETEASLRRSGPYMAPLREVFADAEVPPSLALLSAVGDDTSRRIGLLVSAKVEDRAALERTARDAARYLHAVHDRYGDWPLALAAYHAGVERVDHALAQQPGASFWELSDAGLLPTESEEFVPRFLAVVRLTEARALCPRSPVVAARTDSPAGSGVVSAFRPQLVTGRGLSLRQPVTEHSALAVSAGSGPRRDAPDVRLMLGFQYRF